MCSALAHATHTATFLPVVWATTRLEYGGRMVKDQDSPPSLDFQIDASSPSKRPEQFAALLDSALRREFPEALDVVEIAQVPYPPGVRLKGLEKLEEDAAKRLTHAARAVFNDCMISPWY